VSPRSGLPNPLRTPDAPRHVQLDPGSGFGRDRRDAGCSGSARPTPRRPCRCRWRGVGCAVDQDDDAQRAALGEAPLDGAPLEGIGRRQARCSRPEWALPGCERGRRGVPRTICVRDLGGAGRSVPSPDGMRGHAPSRYKVTWLIETSWAGYLALLISSDHCEHGS
jgi:hypothetical protein